LRINGDADALARHDSLIGFGKGQVSMDQCSSCGHARAEHWPAAPVPLGDADQRGNLQTLDAYLDRLVEAQWPADRESACKLCRCSY
jgi:hypothetical protein